MSQSWNRLCFHGAPWFWQQARMSSACHENQWHYNQGNRHKSFLMHHRRDVTQLCPQFHQAKRIVAISRPLKRSHSTSTSNIRRQVREEVDHPMKYLLPKPFASTVSRKRDC